MNSISNFVRESVDIVYGLHMISWLFKDVFILPNQREHFTQLVPLDMSKNLEFYCCHLLEHLGLKNYKLLSSFFKIY